MIWNGGGVVAAAAETNAYQIIKYMCTIERARREVQKHIHPTKQLFLSIHTLSQEFDAVLLSAAAHTAAMRAAAIMEGRRRRHRCRSRCMR